MFEICFDFLMFRERAGMILHFTLLWAQRRGWDSKPYPKGPSTQ